LRTWAGGSRTLGCRAELDASLLRLKRLYSAPAPRVQAFAFTPKELAEAQARRDPRAIELLESGVFLAGERDVRALLHA
jgi:hypothetical protein